ncbi:hypothetical protein [Oryzifoliimicrobium ureilyticus]|uniref:hypothetical protein n=1 Tax=Oryzifoliimicrobium ureilyticus TaxID=3113724 RepID=UPI003076120A
MQAAQQSLKAPHDSIDVIAAQLSLGTDEDHASLQATMNDAKLDDALIEGLYRYLDQAAAAPFINVMKLDKLGLWIGQKAPGRLQIRLMEVAKSSLHPSFAAFRGGLSKSGGLQRAFPTAKI